MGLTRCSATLCRMCGLAPAPPGPPDLAERVERFAVASGVDPDTVMPIHGHRNLVTGATAVAVARMGDWLAWCSSPTISGRGWWGCSRMRAASG